MDDLSANEKTLNSRFPFDKELVLQELWVKSFKLEDIDYYSKNGWKPCIEVTSFNSWESNFSTENIQPTASAILNFKLVPNQKVEAIKSLFQEWVKGNILSDADYELTFSWESEPLKLDISNYFANRAETLLRQISGEKVGEILSW
jgi:acetylornithine deacetylase/succinyl-diaminopimelate desuccinylase-like protein